MWRVVHAEFHHAIALPRDVDPRATRRTHTVSVYESDGVTPSGFTLTPDAMGGLVIACPWDAGYATCVPPSNIVSWRVETLDEDCYCGRGRLTENGKLCMGLLPDDPFEGTVEVGADGKPLREDAPE